MMRRFLAGAGGLLLVGCSGELSDTGQGMPANPPGATEIPVAPIPTELPDDSQAPASFAELFECDPEAGPALPQRLVRLSNDEYALAVAAAATGRSQDANVDLQPYTRVEPFLVTPPSGRYSTRVTDHVVDSNHAASVFRAAADAARFIVSELGASCPEDAMDACVRPLIRSRGEILFGRPLEASEVDRYVGLAVELAGDIGSQAATEVAFEAMLRAPQFLYRVELGNGAGQLTQYELAQAIAYGVTNGPPDTVLWQAAVNGSLGEAAAVRAQVERLFMAVEQQGSAARFIDEFVDYGRVVDVTKDSEAYPFHDGHALRDRTVQTLAQVLTDAGREGFLRTLLTFQRGFVGDKTAETFGLLPPNTEEPELVDFPAATRSGFLTDPSWLIARSEPHRNNPISRGKFIRVELLCDVVPPIPIDADIQPVPEEPAVPMKQVLEQHRIEASCAGCHQLMDPLGLTFEMYDHVGRYRTEEFGAPIDASGVLSGSADQDGEVADAIELTQHLAASTKVEQCFTVQAYHYYIGRVPIQADACSVSTAHEAFSAKQDMVDLLVSIFSPATYVPRQENTP